MDHVTSKHKVTLDQKFKLPKMTYKGDTIASQRIRKEPKSLVTDLGDVPDEPSFPLRPSKQPAVGAPLSSSSGRQKGVAAAAAAAQQSRTATGASASTSGQMAAAAGGSSSGGNSSKLPSLQHAVSYFGKPVETVLVDVQLPSKGLAGAGAPGTNSSSSTRNLLWSSRDVDVRVAGMELFVKAAGCQPLSIQLPFAVAGEGSTVQLDGTAGVLHVELPYLPVGQYVQKLREAAPVSFGALPIDNAAYLELDP